MTAGKKKENSLKLNVYNSPLNSLWLSSTPREFDSLKEKQQIKFSSHYTLTNAVTECKIMVINRRRGGLTLVDDDSLHSLLELVGGPQAFDGSAQHSLLLRQPALQPGDLVFQQLILAENIFSSSKFAFFGRSKKNKKKTGSQSLVYLLVGAALPCCSAACWKGDPPHQFEQAAGFLQRLLQGVHAAG